MRITTSVSVGGGGIGALAWLAPTTLLAVQETAGERQRLLALDLLERTVSRRTSLGGSVQRLARTRTELVMLVARAQAIGVATIAVADRRGVVRSVRLERILAGSKLIGTGADHRVDSRLPALAVDPAGRRAFVIADNQAAEIDLRTLAVSYHTLKARTSFLSRLWSWLEPAAAAKQTNGYFREARWLGGDLLAISGSDTRQGRTTPTGLRIADTRGWSVRVIDREAVSFEVVGDILLALASSASPPDRPTGPGLVGYGFDGRARFQLFDGQRAWLALVHGGRAYIGLVGQEAEPLRIVDLASEQMVGTREAPLPWLLLGAGSGWWGA